jgi:pyridoxamine 5'-phosphate oxidase
MNKENLDSKISFDTILSEIWEMLKDGAEKSKSDFHLGIICTINNNKPKSRTVVLRKVDQNKNTLIFHTDNRSGKIDEINKNPNISWLFYSNESKIQLRLEGKASVHTDDELFEQQWASSKLISRKCYLIYDQPGSSIKEHDGCLDQSLAGGLPTEEQSEVGKVNFSVVETKIDSIEWLHLKASGHLRAKFILDKDRFKGEWLVP